MVGYIKEIADDIAKVQSPTAALNLVRALSEEINRLDPREFVPAGQYRFVKLRMRAADIARAKQLHLSNLSGVIAFGQEAREVLDLYAGVGGYANLRSFAFVTDKNLRQIVERDYQELSLILLPGRAWKSTVVIAGSILEGILSDLLINPTNNHRALSAAAAPKKKNLAAGEWSLRDLIEVSVELKLLPADRAAAIDQTLRDYRNFVHPLKEIRAAYPCTEAEALLAKGALDAV